MPLHVQQNLGCPLPGGSGSLGWKAFWSHSFSKGFQYYLALLSMSDTLSPSSQHITSSPGFPLCVSEITTSIAYT